MRQNDCPTNAELRSDFITLMEGIQNPLIRIDRKRKLYRARDGMIVLLRSSTVPRLVATSEGMGGKGADLTFPELSRGDYVGYMMLDESGTRRPYLIPMDTFQAALREAYKPGDKSQMRVLYFDDDLSRPDHGFRKRFGMFAIEPLGDEPISTDDLVAEHIREIARKTGWPVESIVISLQWRGCRRGSIVVAPMPNDKVFLRATLPPELLQPFLQHVRDFDTAHPGCHFEVMADANPDENMADMVERLRVDPALTFTKIFNRMR